MTKPTMPNAEEVEADIVVDRRPDYRGWQIRTKDQLPGNGTIVTDHWLAAFGFSAPSKFNINKIIDALAAQMRGYHIGTADPDRDEKLFGSMFTEKGPAPDIEYGEGVGNIH